MVSFSQSALITAVVPHIITRFPTTVIRANWENDTNDFQDFDVTPLWSGWVVMEMKGLKAKSMGIQGNSKEMKENERT